MKPDTPVAIGAAAAAVLSFSDLGWLVSAALILGAAAIVGPCVWFAVLAARTPTIHHSSPRKER